MGNLLASLSNSTNALRAFERQLNVIQNNVTNANTPGYVKQVQALVALRFDPAHGIAGGTQAAPLLNSRSDFLEQHVRRQTEFHGFFDQKSGDLGQLESAFDLNSQFGVPTAMTSFFKSFSQLSINPNDAVARQAIIDQTGEVAASFRQAAGGLNDAGANADHQIHDSVTRINDLVGRLRVINGIRRQDANTKADPGLDATVYSTLEELSGLTNVNALRQDDGTYTLLLGGQVGVLEGETQYKLQADSSAPQTAIRDSGGKDVTSILSGGRIGAALQFQNQIVPSYRADLDQLAQAFADQINGSLANGVDRFGSPPTSNLFSYDSIVGAAYTIGTTNLTPDQIAAALPSAPGGNGNALQIAQLTGQPVINGFTFTQFYGNLSARVGRDLSAAKDSANTQQNLVTQAQSLRSAVSSVSLDEEASQLIQVQRSYQAAAKLIGVLEDLTQTLINLI